MREEHKLNKAIMQDGIETQSEILEELKRRYPQYVEQSDNTKAPVKKRKFAFVYAIAAAVVCAAVVVPCAVILPNRSNGGGSGGDNIRYCAQGEYTKEDVDFTIAEYRASHDLDFLYFDWYEIGEDCITSRYTSNADNEVLCLAENIYLVQSNEFVQLSITKTNVYLSVFDSTISSCTGEQIVDNHTIKWLINNMFATCIFEDSGYRYFIQIQYGQDENRLFELVSELLETK